MSLPNRISVYDRLRPHLDAADLIRRLGLQEARSIGSESYCAPLCHDSTSGESLQINLHTGRWNCKACQSAGIYGDLIQLVEYVLTGGSPPSRGQAQGGSSTHREALTWLCDQFGIPFDEDRVTGDPGLDVVHLFSMAAHRHLLERPQVLEWILDKWGFDRSTVESYGLGFMPTPILPFIAAEAASPGSHEAFRASGLGWYDPTSGKWRTRFEGRVTFPYLEHGRAVYLIGRATPWTPKLDNGARSPKYHKLSVHSDARPYISERVTNDHLYNETIMGTADSVVVAEGVADAVALSALGAPVVSPVTISFNKVDLERFTRKAHEFGLKRVEILFDNELSGSGNWAARRAGLQLVERGIAAKILTLPLGEEQQRARDEVVSALGPELFDELERSDPRERKELILRAIPDNNKRAWITEHVAASKIDAAEWTAQQGAGAPGKFNAIRAAGVDVLELEILEISKTLDLETLDATDRAGYFGSVIALAAYIDDRLTRDGYAASIAKAAGKGVPKTEIARRIAAVRRGMVLPARKDKAEAEKVDPAALQRELVVPPPEPIHVQPAAPAAPKAPSRPGAPAAPTPPKKVAQSEEERFASTRVTVAKAVAQKLPEEELGKFVAQVILRSMGFTPFRTADELYLVRGSERVPMGLAGRSPTFDRVLMTASGLTSRKSSHAGYIESTKYALETPARKAQDVSWSHVDPSGAVFFPTGDRAGHILRIEPGKVTRTRMSEARVPCVAGIDFEPFGYTEDDGGIERALQCFRWTSLSEGDRLLLIYWLVCLPILRRIGTIPIVRIEGGSSSGKTRAVDAVSYLVNGRKSASVPTAAALVSRMSTEMLTVDDNREARDVTPAFLGTLLQATHLGAREKRKANKDTGTVIERISGALLMNGIEPIHDGRPELASRIITLRCSDSFRASDSPTAEDGLRAALIGNRSAFWSEAVRRCADALELDTAHGEEVGKWFDELFGSTKIGRLSAYLRVMYLAWVAGCPPERRSACLAALAPEWVHAARRVAQDALRSLLAEELVVTVLRYVWAHGLSLAEGRYQNDDERRAFDGKFVVVDGSGESFLGPIGVPQLARLARAAGKELNAPRAVTTDLRAGQLEQRLLDGVAFAEAAGFAVQVDETRKGKLRFTFSRNDRPASPPDPSEADGDTWTGP